MTAVLLAISQKDLTNSLVQGMVQGEQQWLISTVAAFMPALWTLSLMLHIARPYMVRMVRNLTLRFAADVWWLSFVLVRDAVMIITFALSLVFFLPGFARNIALPLTGPVAGVFLFWALLVKLTGDVDDNPRHYRLADLLHGRWSAPVAGAPGAGHRNDQPALLRSAGERADLDQPP